MSAERPGKGTTDMAGASHALQEDTGFVARAQAGDTDAFEHLYRTHVGRVHAVCLRMTGNLAQAEEATQEAFVRAWRKLGSFRGDSAFSTWLHRLTVNVVLTGLRSEKRRTARVIGTDDLTAFERAPRRPAPGARMDLEQAIAALPDRARTVFVLHDVEGYRHNEIAAMLGLATGTSKAQLHRARKLLRKELG